MGKKIKIYRGAEYIYPEPILPLKPVTIVESYDPNLVPYQNGAIGFCFAKIIYLELPSGEAIHHVESQNDTYYWGQEIELDDLIDCPDYEFLEDEVDTTRFCLTSWGALIPLDDYEIVVPYPRVIELPIDMRLE